MWEKVIHPIEMISTNVITWPELSVKKNIMVPTPGRHLPWCWLSYIENNQHPWWRHHMEIYSALLSLCEENSSRFSSQRPVTRSFEVVSERYRAHYDVTIIPKYETQHIWPSHPCYIKYPLQYGRLVGSKVNIHILRERVRTETVENQRITRVIFSG